MCIKDKHKEMNIMLKVFTHAKVLLLEKKNMYIC